MEWWQRVRGRVTAAGVELSVRDLGLQQAHAGPVRAPALRTGPDPVRKETSGRSSTGGGGNRSTSHPVRRHDNCSNACSPLRLSWPG